MFMNSKQGVVAVLVYLVLIFHPLLILVVVANLRVLLHFLLVGIFNNQWNNVVLLNLSIEIQG